MCIDYRTDEEIRNGELSRRIYALSAWQESTLFTRMMVSESQINF